MGQNEERKNVGQLGRQDFIDENNKDDGLKIIPFNKDIDLKSASYDITPTIIAMSSRLGMLETVYREKGSVARYYVYVKAKDTVLVVSKEYILVPPNIAGYVVSRVSRISDGFGHVSTSIDPNWKGALLIGLSNPTNKAIKVYVGGERDETTKGDALATISFHYLKTPDNTSLDSGIRGMRLDLLNRIKYTERTGIKAWIRRILHSRRCNFTKTFFDYIEQQNVCESSWEHVVKTLCGTSEDDRLTKFIVKENIVLRFIHWFENYGKFVMTIIILIFIFFYYTGIMPDDIKNKILEVIGMFKELIELLF